MGQNRRVISNDYSRWRETESDDTKIAERLTIFDRYDIIKRYPQFDKPNNETNLVSYLYDPINHTLSVVASTKR